MSAALFASHVRRQLVSQHTQVMGFATGSKIKEIASQTEWDTLLKGCADAGRPLVAEFTATWCPPCRMIAPVLEELAGKHADVDFVKIDIDNSSVAPVVSAHGVSSVPTFVSYRGDQRGTSFSGADKAALTRMVKDLLNA